MRLARVVSPIVFVAALGWGCTQDTAGPKTPARLSAALVGPADFNYIANPPNVQVTSGEVAPDGLPYCSSTFVCYAPSFVRKAYNFPSTLDGSGQTILIVDAFGSPTVRQDL